VLGKLPAIFVGAGFTNNLSFISTIFINPPSSYVIFICKNSDFAPCSITGFPASQKFNFLVGVGLRRRSGPKRMIENGAICE
jgi:hypothetical protein